MNWHLQERWKGPTVAGPDAIRVLNGSLLMRIVRLKVRATRRAIVVLWRVPCKAEAVGAGLRKTKTAIRRWFARCAVLPRNTTENGTHR